MRLKRQLALACLALIFAVRMLAGNPYPTALPDFQVMRPDGSPVTTSEVHSSGRWLVVFVRQNSPGCDRFLRLFGTSESDLASHMTIIVSGLPADKLSELSGKFPDLTAAQWYADPADNGTSSLQIKAMPMMFGGDGNTIDWALVGVPSGDTVRLKAIARSWIKSEELD